VQQKQIRTARVVIGAYKVGWAKGIELAKLVRRDRQDFDCAIWLHKTRAPPPGRTDVIRSTALTAHQKMQTAFCQSAGETDR